MPDKTNIYKERLDNLITNNPDMYDRKYNPRKLYANFLTDLKKAIKQAKKEGVPIKGNPRVRKSDILKYAQNKGLSPKDAIHFSQLFSKLHGVENIKNKPPKNVIKSSFLPLLHKHLIANGFAQTDRPDIIKAYNSFIIANKQKNKNSGSLSELKEHLKRTLPVDEVERAHLAIKKAHIENGTFNPAPKTNAAVVPNVPIQTTKEQRKPISPAPKQNPPLKKQHTPLGK